MDLFTACAPGLEPLLADEVRALGVEPAVTAGGVEAAGDAALLYRANLELGLALKVLVRLGTFEARGFPALVRGAAALPWEAFCTRESVLRFKVSARKSRLYHSGAVAERLRTAIEERLGGATADDGGPELIVHARLERDRCTISVDSSGELLSRRGYRQATAKAPLREDLARALVLLSGWRGDQPLFDPFAGAGTIAIEAALVASRTPPGHRRRFAFMDAPSFDAGLWASILERALGDRRPLDPDAILASDRDAGAVGLAAANAERAGFALRFHQAPLGRAPWVTAPPAGPVALVTNPPYGGRVGDRRTLGRLYRSLGDRARALPDGSAVALAVGSQRLAAATGLPLRSALMTDHGGSKIYLMVAGRSPSGPESG
jgi:putative N6-adenine-specific DNA methylase